MVLIVAACSPSRQNEDGCPQMDVSKENSKIYQSDNISDKFQVNLNGYDAYCYTDIHNNRRYAVIAPIFKVRRLESSQTDSLDVDFYIKNNGNPQDYFGERVYNQQLNIERNVREQTIKGKEISIRIPRQPYNDFRLELGLKKNFEQNQKVKRMFDIDHRFLTEEELALQNEKAVEDVYLEIFSDEEIVYSTQKQKPEIAKKDRLNGKCGSACGN